VSQQRLDDRHQEFPRTDDRVTGRQHRFGYSAVIGEGLVATTTVEYGITSHDLGNALLKHDLVAGTAETHQFGEAETLSEAVFVPASADAAEDDGYLMGYVHDPNRGAADLMILAAQDFTGAPVARVHLPARIPQGFHGNWIPDD
jgi:carotenoid cleavage dioxygenase